MLCKNQRVKYCGIQRADKNLAGSESKNVCQMQVIKKKLLIKN
jgi:hypothetical protein